MDGAQLQQKLKDLRAVVNRLETQILGLLTLANAINAKTQRASANLSNVATGLSTTTITWPTAWPDTQYGIWITVIATGDAPIVATYTPVQKTAVDAQIVLNNTSGGTITSVVLDVLGVRT
jgi:hypothetical protein